MAALDFAFEKLGHHLQPEADAENGDAQFKDGLVRQRGVLGVNAGRAAGENNSTGVHLRDNGGGRVVVDNGGVHLALADATGDHLRVLGPKIKNDNLFVHVAEKRGMKPRYPRFCETKNLAKRGGKRLWFRILHQLRDQLAVPDNHHRAAGWRVVFLGVVDAQRVVKCRGDVIG